MVLEDGISSALPFALVADAVKTDSDTTSVEVVLASGEVLVPSCMAVEKCPFLSVVTPEKKLASAPVSSWALPSQSKSV
jgi:hypothetical protein